eukprot:s1784_g2.t3
MVNMLQRIKCLLLSHLKSHQLQRWEERLALSVAILAMEDSVKLRLPPEDDEILALPPSQAVHPGHLWEHPASSKDSSGVEHKSPMLGPLEEASPMEDVLSRADLQHEKVMKMLRANEKMLRRVLNGIHSLHVSTSTPNALSMLHNKSARSSQSSSMGKMDSLRSQGGMRNPRSLDADIKVNSQNIETKWDKIKPQDAIVEGKSSEGSLVTRNSSSPTIFQSYTAFDLGLKEEAQATQAERTRRKFASVRQKLSGLGTSVVSTRTIQKVTKAIQHPLFDAFFAGVVFVNAIFTGLEVESSIAQQQSRTLLSDWQIRFSHYVFFTLFLFELIARLFLYGRSFFCSYDWMWNWLDIAIVASSFVEIIIDVYEEATQFEGRNPMSGLKVFRIIRLTRLVKTIRLVRIFRFVVALRTLVPRYGSASGLRPSEIFRPVKDTKNVDII